MSNNRLNLQRRVGGFDALREFIGDMLGNDAILPWEHNALLALIDNLARQSPTTAQDRQKHGFVR